MQTNGNSWPMNKILTVSAAAGLLVLLILLIMLSFSAWWSIFWGVVVGAVVFFILMLNYGDAGDGDDYASESGPGGGQATAEGAAATGAAADAESVTPADSGAAADAGVGDDQAPGDAGALVKPSTVLPGQTELAGRKGKLKYQGGTGGGDDEAAAVAADPGGGNDKDRVHESTGDGSKPAMLTEARAGGADNLKEIMGVGPKMVQLLNALGVYHFDQVAAWSADEVAWVDANLKGFKGQVSRYGWVDQAKILAAGGDTEFSERVDKGEVY